MEPNTMEEILSHAIEQIPHYCPEWTNYNPSDPGITLLELFAWLKEIQDFHMEQTGNAHKQEYGKLLGTYARGRRPGRTFITADCPEGILIPKGTVFRAEDVVFETQKDQEAIESNFAGFRCSANGCEYLGAEENPGSLEIRGQWLAAGRGISLYPFGRQPKEGNAFIIFLLSPLKPGHPYGLYVSFALPQEVLADQKQRLSVDQTAFGSRGFYPLAQMELKYAAPSGWKNARILEDDTYGFLQNGIIRFMIDQAMDENTPALSFSLTRCGYELPPCINRMSLAMIPVLQVETVFQSLTFSGNGLPDQRFSLNEPDLYGDTLRVWVENPMEKGQMDLWKRARDFDASKPWDRHYVLEDHCLRFGNAYRGLPPEGQITIGRYERTRGVGGNVKAGAITQMIRRKRSGDDKENICPDSLRIYNEFDVAGGSDKENMDQALERWRRTLSVPWRAVTPKDYERLAFSIPGLLIKDCHAYGAQGKEHTIVLAVRPFSLDGRGVLNDAYRKNLFRYFEDRRMAGTKIEVRSPEYFEFTVSCEAVAKGNSREAAAILDNCIRSWAKGFTFGDVISVSSLYGKIDALFCIRRIRGLYLDFGKLPGQEGREIFTLPPWGLAILLRTNCVLLT